LAYLQAATNNLFGLAPASGVPGPQQTNLYAVSSSEGTAVLAGDCIVRTSIGTVRVAVSADSLHMMGAAAQGLTTASFAQGTQNLLVYDDPQQYFVITNTTSANLTMASIGQNVGIVTTATGTGAPSSLVSRSKHALSATVTSSAGIVRLVSLHPIETYSSNPTGALKWIVKPAPATDFVSNLTT
jgi:hypothetical protein